MSYQGLLLLMYRLARPVFDMILASTTASPALKSKLSFLVTVFNADGAAITLSEVNPAYVTARYMSMTEQSGFRMNASSLKTLLTSFRICFNVLRVGAAQRQAAVSGQRSFEQLAIRRAEFTRLRTLKLFQRKRGREGEEEEVSEADEEGGSSAVTGEHSRKERTVSSIQALFRGYEIEISNDAIARVCAECQNAAQSACLVLAQRYWSKAKFNVDAVVDAKYSRGPQVYRAKVEAVHEDGTFLVKWEDGDDSDRVKKGSDFQFPRIERDEWRRWIDGHNESEFPEFPRKFV